MKKQSATPKKVMIRAFVLAAFVFAALIQSGHTVPVPVLNLDELTSSSSVVVTGTIESLQIGHEEEVPDGISRVIGRSVNGTLRIDQTIKGLPESADLKFEYLLTDQFRGWRSVELHQFAMFFLSKAGHGSYRFTSPYYPYVVVSHGVRLSGITPIERIISLIAGTAFDEKVTLQQRLAETELLAASADPSAATRLKDLLNNSPQVIRVAAAAVLLRKGDCSGIDLLVDVLLQRRVMISDNTRQDAMAAISWGAANSSTAIKVKTLLASSDPDVRRAGACNLMRSGSQEAIKPLLSALNDTDFETRYYAVAGLAQITGQDDWRPTIDQFRENERKYLQHWKDWR